MNPSTIVEAVLAESPPQQRGRELTELYRNPTVAPIPGLTHSLAGQVEATVDDQAGEVRLMLDYLEGKPTHLSLQEAAELRVRLEAQGHTFVDVENEVSQRLREDWGAAPQCWSDAEPAVLPDSAVTVILGGAELARIAGEQFVQRGVSTPYPEVVKILGVISNLQVTVIVDPETGGAEASAALPAGLPGIVRVKGDNLEA